MSGEAGIPTLLHVLERHGLHDEAELVQSLTAALKDAERERERLRRALLMYGEHTTSCSRPKSAQALCDCGLEDLIREALQEPAPQGAETAPSADPGKEAMNGLGLIAAERQRQIEEEGWTLEHDDSHGEDELAMAAACYALPAGVRRWQFGSRGPILLRSLWPWEPKWFKRSDRKRELVKAGALIAAEIDRLERLSKGAEKAALGEAG